MNEIWENGQVVFEFHRGYVGWHVQFNWFNLISCVRQVFDQPEAAGAVYALDVELDNVGIFFRSV